MTGLRLLTDENIDPQVIAHLRHAGFDVLDIFSAGLQGRPDRKSSIWPISNIAPS